jgi:hypothetical protein
VIADFSSTPAPEISAPEGSVTVPLIAARSWADIETAKKHKAANAHRMFTSHFDSIIPDNQDNIIWFTLQIYDGRITAQLKTSEGIAELCTMVAF